jgi:hypothetical protein
LCEQRGNEAEQQANIMTQIRGVLRDLSLVDLASDAAGVAALVVLLVSGLALPSFF